jgi:hypothetical protein
MKEFIIKFTANEGHMEIESKNEGFNGLEIIGMLTLKIDDIRDQVKGLVKPEIIRKFVTTESEDK